MLGQRCHSTGSLLQSICSNGEEVGDKLIVVIHQSCQGGTRYMRSTDTIHCYTYSSHLNIAHLDYVVYNIYDPKEQCTSCLPPSHSGIERLCDTSGSNALAPTTFLCVVYSCV